MLSTAYRAISRALDRGRRRHLGKPSATETSRAALETFARRTEQFSSPKNSPPQANAKAPRSTAGEKDLEGFGRAGQDHSLRKRSQRCSSGKAHAKGSRRRAQISENCQTAVKAQGSKVATTGRGARRPRAITYQDLLEMTRRRDALKELGAKGRRVAIYSDDPEAPTRCCVARIGARSPSCRWVSAEALSGRSTTRGEGLITSDGGYRKAEPSRSENADDASRAAKDDERSSSSAAQADVPWNEAGRVVADIAERQNRVPCQSLDSATALSALPWHDREARA